MIISFKGRVLNDQTKTYKNDDGEEFKKRQLTVYPEGSEYNVKVTVPTKYQYKADLHTFTDVYIKPWFFKGKVGISLKISDKPAE